MKKTMHQKQTLRQTEEKRERRYREKRTVFGLLDIATKADKITPKAHSRIAILIRRRKIW